MQLDERSVMVLEELLLAPGVRISHLTAKFNLSRSQVIYTIDKINDWLESNYYPIIENDRQLGLIIDHSVREKFPNLVPTSETEYIPSVKERTYYIILMLLSRQELLSLYHIADQLKVSRNTALADLKKLGNYVEPYNVELKYTRQEGYYLLGKEFDKRKLMIELIPKILNVPNGFETLLHLTRISKEEFNGFRKTCEDIEEELKIRFTDEKLEELPFVFLLLKRRINCGKNVSFDYKKYTDLTKTKEYQSVQKLVPTINNVDEIERLYITLQLLSLSNFNFSLNVTQDASLRKAINDTLTTFEKLACVTFDKYEELAEKFYQHMKPASYRIKYKLALENPLINEIKREYSSIHHLVNQSLKPIEDLLETTIPEGEKGFITILVTSWLQEQGKSCNKQPSAIVICPNGISVSRLLLGTLKEMFPDINFLEHMSVRDFYKYKDSYDIIFSTVLLDTPKKFFLIKPFISEADKRNLKIRVNQEIFGFTPEMVDFSSLLKVIKKHATIKNESVLLHDIRNFFNEQTKKNQSYLETNHHPNLNELLTSERIYLKRKVKSVAEAIRSAVNPLIEENAVEPRYAEAILNIMNENEPYMFIAPGVAIPHASPEDGVNKLSMSMLRLQEAVEIAPGFPVKIFIVIAAVDRKQHLKALSQLNELVDTQGNIKRLEASTSINEIASLIESYSTGESLEGVIEN